MSGAHSSSLTHKLSSISKGATMLRAQVVGHVCVDITPTLNPHTDIDPGKLLEVGPLAFSAGGCVANTGAGLAELGAEVYATAQVGSDTLGDTLSALLREGGMAPELLIDAEAATSYSIVIERPLPHGREDRTFWHHVGANASFDGAQLVDSFEPQIDLMHLGYPPLLPALLPRSGAPLIELLQSASVAGATTSVDMVVVDPEAGSGRWDWSGILAAAMPHIDVFCPSLDDLRTALHADPGLRGLTSDPGRLAATFVEMGAGLVVITDGPEGFYARAGSRDRLERAGRLLSPLADVWADAIAHQRALPVEEIVTTNAAGDISVAGLLTALHEQLPPEAALQRAAEVAAAHIGGEPLPRMA